MTYSISKTQINKATIEAFSIKQEEKKEIIYLNEEHKIIKDIIFLLKKNKWKEGFDHYEFKIKISTKREIEILIFKRYLLFNSLFKDSKVINSFKENEINELIISSFKYVINEDIKKKEFALNFIKILFIPSINNYTINTFEQCEAQSVLKSAKEILHSIWKTIGFSPNHANRNDLLMNAILSNNIPQPKSEYTKKVMSLDNELDKLIELRDVFFIKNPKLKKNTFLQVVSFSQVCQDLHIGRCEQMAGSGLLQSHKISSRRMEMWAIKNGDHVFNVFNPDEDSDWGLHCYVIDAWAKENNVFPAHDIPLYLKDFIELDTDGNPVLADFDPKSNELELLCENMFSLRSFSGLTDKKEGKDQDSIKWVELKLKAFYDTPSLENKKSIAEEVIITHHKMHSKTNKLLLKTFISQMKFYLDPDYIRMLNIGPKQNLSLFDAFKIEETFFDAYVSITTIDHLLKISDLFNLGKEDKAKKKFEKLPPSIKNPLKKKISMLEKSKTDSGWNSLCIEAINAWIGQKAALARKNHKEEEASIILSRLGKLQKLN